MADEHRIAETVDPSASARPAARAAQALPRNGDPEAVRAEIEMTRARMSDTIDEIEDALLRKKEEFQSKKEEIQNRMDVSARIREKPMQSAMAALAAGLALGLLTGGEGAEGVEREYEGRLTAADRRARTWESRARRLMRVARRQEHEIRMQKLRAREAERAAMEHGMHLERLHLTRRRHRDRPEANGSVGDLWHRLTDTVSDTARGLFARA